MLIKIEQNITPIDLALTLNGTLDNIYLDILSKYQIESLDTDLTNLEFDVEFNTNNRLVNQLFINNKKIATGDSLTFESLVNPIGEFNSDYSNDFSNL